MTYLMIILSLFAAFVGFIVLSQATLGVGIMAGACLLAILARMAQASEHQCEIIKLHLEIKQLCESKNKKSPDITPKEA